MNRSSGGLSIQLLIVIVPTVIRGNLYAVNLDHWPTPQRKLRRKVTIWMS